MNVSAFFASLLSFRIPRHISLFWDSDVAAAFWDWSIGATWLPLFWATTLEFTLTIFPLWLESGPIALLPVS